jgi:AAHS family 4-hydroxybenzoate transporter-like MFS transporter
LLVIALGMSEMASWQAGVVFMAGLAIGGPLTCVNTIPGIFYPTALRASGGGWTVAIGRLGSIIGSSLIGVIVISGFPFLIVCVLLSIPLLTASACMFVMARVLSAQQRLSNEHRESSNVVLAHDPSLPNSTMQ